MSGASVRKCSDILDAAKTQPHAAAAKKNRNMCFPMGRDILEKTLPHAAAATAVRFYSAALVGGRNHKRDRMRSRFSESTHVNLWLLTYYAACGCWKTVIFSGIMYFEFAKLATLPVCKVGNPTLICTVSFKHSSGALRFSHSMFIFRLNIQIAIVILLIWLQK